MNNLYNINCKICNWDDLVINLLNGYMLADFLLQAVDMKQC